MKVSSVNQARRSGATLLMVVICLLFVTAIMGSMLRQFSLAKKQRRQLERKSQATLLAESAIERAAFNLKQDSAYSGEVWQISAAELNSRHAGKADINIQRTNESPRVQVHVTASFPADSEHRATVRKQIEILDD